MVVLVSPDGTTATIMNGRYVDRLEKRDGNWRIAVRRSTVDAVVTGDASMLQIVTYSAPPRTDSADKFALLAAWAATHQAEAQQRGDTRPHQPAVPHRPQR
jgi:hypothetical protein